MSKEQGGVPEGGVGPWLHWDISGKGHLWPPGVFQNGSEQGLARKFICTHQSSINVVFLSLWLWLLSLLAVLSAHAHL